MTIPLVRVVCGCGCGEVGAPRARAWRDGTHCVRRCSCKRCAGGRTKSTARRRENRIAKDIGGRRNLGSGAFGGHDVTGVVEVEETAAAAVVRGFRRWWFSKTVTTKTAKVFGQKQRPGVLVLSEGGKPFAAAMPYPAFVQLCLLAQQGNGYQVRGFIQDALRALEKADKATG